MGKEKDKFKWLFQDNTGKYVIGAPPNVPVLLIVLGYIMTTIFQSGAVHNLFAAVLNGAIFLWAYLEIRFGESPFRRVLGVIVMIIFLYSAIKSQG